MAVRRLVRNRGMGMADPPPWKTAAAARRLVEFGGNLHLACVSPLAPCCTPRRCHYSPPACAAGPDGASLPAGSPMSETRVKKVVLAYSGGLDTSIILKWLQTTYACEVVTFTADLGQGEELEPARAEGAAARHQAREHLHRGPARGVRPRLRVPDVPRQRAVRGPLPARHVDRPPADRQEADRDRRAASAPTPSATAPPARATTRCASSSPITR